MFFLNLGQILAAQLQNPKLNHISKYNDQNKAGFVLSMVHLPLASLHFGVASAGGLIFFQDKVVIGMYQMRKDK